MQPRAVDAASGVWVNVAEPDPSEFMLYVPVTVAVQIAPPSFMAALPLKPPAPSGLGFSIFKKTALG